MPYKVTNITTKSSKDIPDFDAWLQNQDISILANFPECAGKTPAQVIQESMETYSDPEEGFISSSSRVSDDGLTWTWETIWESKEAMLNVRNNTSYASDDLDDLEPKKDADGNTVVDDDGNIIFVSKKTAGNYIRQLYQKSYKFINESFEANI